MRPVDELSEDELREEVVALQKHLALLSEASLRINESLAVETVLQGVLDSARLLAGARYGLIYLVSSQGRIEENVYSGITAEQARQLWEMPHAETFQSHMDEFGGTFRIPDLHSHIEAVGLPEFQPPFPVNPVLPFLAVSILDQGDRVGAIYLGDKEPSPTAAEDTVPEFTARDEEAISMFAAQAALVISKAQIHREEQRARAHFETLLNTTPVGVLVFEPESVRLLYANREAERMLGKLLVPGGSLGDLLDSATYRSSQGQQIPVRDLPAVKALRSGEVIMGEEIIVEAEDGRSITAMVSVTPILSDEGLVESAVASLQDMSPIAELEKLRTEFLGMVGHELRTPLAGIKGSASTLLEAGNSLDPAETRQYYRIINEQADYMRDLIADLIDVVRIETGTLSVHPEPTDVSRLVDEGRNSFLSAGGRDNVRINLTAGLPPVMADRRRMTQVINNLLINAARNSHGSSHIRIDAVVEDLHVAISVVDSGKGLDAERLPFLFQKFSAPEDREQGRDLGLGLAICKGIVEAHGGRIWAESDGPGLGSRFTFTVPTSAHMPTSAAAERVHAAATGSPSHEQTRVLAVDDDPRLLKHVRDSLSKAGYSPVVTGDPGEVLSLIAETSPHVVLLDLMLPGSDGVELMQDIHASA